MLKQWFFSLSYQWMIGIAIAFLTLVATIANPELRRWMGLDRPPGLDVEAVNPQEDVLRAVKADHFLFELEACTIEDEMCHFFVTNESVQDQPLWLSDSAAVVVTDGGYKEALNIGFERTKLEEGIPPKTRMYFSLRYDLHGFKVDSLFQLLRFSVKAEEDYPLTLIEFRDVPVD